MNWAARYYPIIRILKEHRLYENGSLLEIGAGPFGIGTFRKVPFVGCDLSFPSEPQWPMTPVIASAEQLPFKDGEFDVVLASDVLEHIPPESRARALSESLRVCKQLAIFGFPCGDVAWRADKDLLQHYVAAGKTPPVWLTEHMEAPFPEPELLMHAEGWRVERFSNERISFHSWLMRSEMSPLFVRVTSLMMRKLPNVTEFMLRGVDGDPAYRQIFALTRIAAAGSDGNGAHGE